MHANQRPRPNPPTSPAVGRALVLLGSPPACVWPTSCRIQQACVPSAPGRPSSGPVVPHYVCDQRQAATADGILVAPASIVTATPVPAPLLCSAYEDNKHVWFQPSEVPPFDQVIRCADTVL